jgi:hypothetical protein
MPKTREPWEAIAATQGVCIRIRSLRGEITCFDMRNGVKLGWLEGCLGHSGLKSDAKANYLYNSLLLIPATMIGGCEPILMASAS